MNIPPKDLNYHDYDYEYEDEVNPPVVTRPVQISFTLMDAFYTILVLLITLAGYLYWLNWRT